MQSFKFFAPNFFDSEALPNSELKEALHDAPGIALGLARLERFALWLELEISKQGLKVDGPSPDEGGWTLSVPAKDGFVLIVISVVENASRRFDILVSDIGNCAEELQQAIAVVHRILVASPNVINLSIE